MAVIVAHKVLNGVKLGLGRTMLFKGEYNNAIDAKGRASIPAKFREMLSSTFGDERLVVTQSDGGLAAYPVRNWEEMLKKVEALPASKFKDALNLSLIAPAVECSFDKQGRIQLTKAQRCYAGLESEIREIVVVGYIDKIMIWNRAKHVEMRQQAEELLKDESQALKDLGF
ncbi:MAG: transcriptional regulator MraZ [Desulfuromonadales bacterium]|nr:transcriptional regulator MraZ [Desulfuromonadales bacterium]